MTERERAITNLMAVDLRGGSHEMLSSIAKAIHKPTCGGWTIGACQVLRDTLVNLLSETDEEALREAYTKGREDGMGVANKADMRAEYLRGRNDGYDEGYDAGFASADDWLGQHEDAMAEHGWLRLPKGADGEYIHVGDELQWADDTDPSVAKVSYLQLNPDGSWYLGIRSRGLCYAPDVLSHYHAPEPDTWERIIEDAMKGADRDGSPDTYQECVAELVARCKALAGDAE